METILRWVALWLAKILESYGDPTLQAKVDKYNADAAAADARAQKAAEEAKLSDAQYVAEDAKRKEWDRRVLELAAQNAESEQRFNDAQSRINARDVETQKLNDAVRARSDDDRFGGVPKSG